MTRMEHLICTGLICSAGAISREAIGGYKATCPDGRPVYVEKPKAAQRQCKKAWQDIAVEGGVDFDSSAEILEWIDVHVEAGQEQTVVRLAQEYDQITTQLRAGYGALCVRTLTDPCNESIDPERAQLHKWYASLRLELERLKQKVESGEGLSPEDVVRFADEAGERPVSDDSSPDGVDNPADSRAPVKPSGTGSEFAQAAKPLVDLSIAGRWRVVFAEDPNAYDCIDEDPFQRFVTIEPMSGMESKFLVKISSTEGEPYVLEGTQKGDELDVRRVEQWKHDAWEMGLLRVRNTDGVLIGEMRVDQSTWGGYGGCTALLLVHGTRE
jgi:hypothetical protein